MNNYSSDFNDFFCISYDNVYKNYPHAMMFLDMMLRNFEAGNKSYVLRNIKSAALTVPLAILYSVCFEALLRFNKPKENVLISRANGYQVVSKVLKEEIGGACLIPDARMGFKRLYDIFSFKSVDLNLYFLGGWFFFLFSIYSLIFGINGFVSCRRLMILLEKTASKRYAKVAHAGKRLKIKTYITSDDHSYAGRAVCLALKSIGVKTICIAHGYLQNRQLITIIPRGAEYLLLWSDKEVENLVSLYPELQGYAFSCGCPKVSRDFLFEFKERKKTDSRRIYFVCDPLFASGVPDSDKLEIMGAMQDQAESLGYNMVFRLHPKDRKFSQYLPSRMRFSKSNLYEDFLDAAFVVGFDSSTLYESVVLGIRAWQLSDLSSFYFSEVERIESKHLMREIASADDITSSALDKKLYFDEELLKSLIA